MPRQARIDIPGQMYHVMSRGIERGEIFSNEADYAEFKEWMGVWLKKSGAKCLAWCLMPNHFHFLILRGHLPLSVVMHHVMTGYAVNYNLKHRRAGHLFQNRYKAIICDMEEYLQELVPYIHLNPLRAKMVKDLAELEDYKWCSHGAAATGVTDEILDRAALLAHFGADERKAVERYIEVMVEKAGERSPTNLSGGGLVRSLGGRGNTVAAIRAGGKALSDQRILGAGDFVEEVLKAAEEAAAAPLKSREELLVTVAKYTRILAADILRPSHERRPARARAIYCYLCKEKAGATGTELMRELKVSQSGISRLIGKGWKFMESAKLVI